MSRDDTAAPLSLLEWSSALLASLGIDPDRVLNYTLHYTTDRAATLTVTHAVTSGREVVIKDRPYVVRAIPLVDDNAGDEGGAS